MGGSEAELLGRRARLDTALEPQEIVGKKDLAAKSSELDFAIVLSRVIASIENDPAQLRSAVYELAIDHQIEPGRLLDWPPCTFEIDRAIRGVTPALSGCRRPLHRRLSESEKPTVSPQRSPETREQVGRLFRRCDLFDWRFFGSGFFAMFIGGVQQPIDQAGAALLHDPRGLGLRPILENFVISLVAHDILHLRSTNGKATPQHSPQFRANQSCPNSSSE